jgi:hypothetical protein
MSDPAAPPGESDSATDGSDVVALVLDQRPLSSNKNVGAGGVRYQQRLADLYRQAGGVWSNGYRYGLIYYLARQYRPKTDVDVGNISKRIWDALEGVAYDDDQVVRLQTRGLIETEGTDPGGIDLAQLDLTDVP